jgi:hypothetical protein
LTIFAIQHSTQVLLVRTIITQPTNWLADDVTAQLHFNLD